MRNCKKRYVNRRMLSWAGLWEPKVLFCTAIGALLFLWMTHLNLHKNLCFKIHFFLNWVINDIFKTLKAASVKCHTSQELTRNPMFIRRGSRTLPTFKMELLMTILKLTTFSWKLLLQITLSLLLVEVLDLLLAKYNFLICYTTASVQGNITYWAIS